MSTACQETGSYNYMGSVIIQRIDDQLRTGYTITGSALREMPAPQRSAKPLEANIDKEKKVVHNHIGRDAQVKGERP